MTSRKFFLIQGGLATTALLALKPFKALANITSSFTGFGSQNAKLVLFHSTHFNAYNNNNTIQYINAVKKNNANTILLHAGKDGQNETSQLAFDVSLNGSNSLSALNEEYKIITNGNIKTGIIKAKHGERDVINKINRLSAYLKKEKNCTVVVCLSQLGYKNKYGPDDMNLANQSTHLDIIIGGHAENFHPHPMIALNKNNAEVVIQSSSDNHAIFGKIEIDFDEQGRKKFISLNNKLSNTALANQAISAA